MSQTVATVLVGVLEEIGVKRIFGLIDIAIPRGPVLKQPVACPQQKDND